ncbi:MAG: dimethyl sulfoxide reductase anchor subunit [Edaphobacter sp.]|uniref:DmsC/YnfH family molybdoenzyme membrane anchor subunit n=1 Tax=Edaphobacter sp. TaxID=1934404 RepID=UPI002397C6C3|nr:DmsC/YnfH family molybdoenzyme membrane anchor subunit [Edaphobacter sp.]MDE1177941.1 dimethyl sulfoxide reductase anchor subunit [Edaphobacter sp.]
MSLPLHEIASSGIQPTLVRLTEHGLSIGPMPNEIAPALEAKPSLIPARALKHGEQYRFHFDMTRCIGCRSCEVACNEQNGNPADIHWRRVGEIEGGTWPLTSRFYLSMGCNHCLSADCLRGCPVDAYKKDPVTGIVLHSAEACIGCQYCVWNCPYSVPQFNPERGVVGKCDMCHGRLTTGLEPACVNACPENAIEIEIVDQLGWRCDHASADAPGMPNAGQTLSTTRITLPARASAPLEKVDIETLRPEHPHWSLVWMTSLIQLSVGALVTAVVTHRTDPILLSLIFVLTVFTLNISVLHLGRPAYAWRALKMWRRSWLSREVLLFGLFFSSLTVLTALAWLRSTNFWLVSDSVFTLAQILASLCGIAGILASARIYLVPARPAWNMRHTPVDFLLSSAVLGVIAISALSHLASALSRLPQLAAFQPTQRASSIPATAIVVVSVLWILNHILRTIVLHNSNIYERRAAASLLNTEDLRGTFLVSFAFLGLALFLSLTGQPLLALPAALAAVMASRYLFFVSVVPLNMALTFIRQVHA